MNLTSTQLKLIERMQAGHRLWWFGNRGPKLSGFPFSPTKRTVRALVRDGVFRWKPPLNQTHTGAGIYELEQKSIEIPEQMRLTSLDNSLAIPPRLG